VICCGSQVFLDVVESVNLLVNSNGTVVRSEVVGALKMRTYLSGMPECKLGLNDKVRSRVQPSFGPPIAQALFAQRQHVRRSRMVHPTLALYPTPPCTQSRQCRCCCIGGQPGKCQ